MFWTEIWYVSIQVFLWLKALYVPARVSMRVELFGLMKPKFGGGVLITNTALKMDLL